MVRNTTGGSGNKKFARKHASSKGGIKLRVSEDEGELFAVTTKNLGNNMFHAFATDGLTYLVHIRGKFSGRGRRDNTLAAGVWVLIGLREWSNKTVDPNSKQKMQQSDLLEVYSDMDKVRLKDAVDEDWEILLANDPTRINKADNKYEDESHWQTDKDVEKARLLDEIQSGTCAKISLSNEAKIVTDFKAPVFDLEVYIEDI